MSTKIYDKEYLSLKEINKLEDEIQKQKLKVSEEKLKLVKMEYKAMNLGLYDHIIELFIKKAHASLEYEYCDNNFNITLLNSKFKQNALKNMRSCL